MIKVIYRLLTGQCIHKWNDWEQFYSTHSHALIVVQRRGCVKCGFVETKTFEHSCVGSGAEMQNLLRELDYEPED